MNLIYTYDRDGGEILINPESIVYATENTSRQCCVFLKSIDKWITLRVTLKQFAALATDPE